MWTKIEDVWNDFKGFFDRVVGWLYYVFGNADDPYIYDDFFDNIFPKA